jgi:hypothetical protein
MGIEATTSAVSSAAATQAAGTTSSSSKTNSSDTSFKDEISKVSESETKKDAKTSDKETKNLTSDQKNDAKDGKLSSSKNENERNLALQNDEANKLQGAAMLNGQFSINDANIMLSNDIQQMIENTVSVNEANLKNWTFGFGESLGKSSLKMNESDADFFINLTQNEGENINVQSIQTQAQEMLNKGTDVAEVKQNVQVSQALLDALSKARENNQPLRIDFDQNVSVILRVGRDGAISAQFIPGDKAVEQYLRNNIDTLRNSFDEQDLPYSDLSYSHSSKEQNQKRREEKQQGD